MEHYNHKYKEQLIVSIVSYKLKGVVDSIEITTSQVNDGPTPRICAGSTFIQLHIQKTDCADHIALGVQQHKAL